jgi:hypothetical protein
MVLLDQVIQIFRRADLGLGRKQAVGLLAHGPVRDRVTIECDGFRWLPLMLDGLLEKAFAAATSRLVRSMKSTVWPTRSTAR